MRTDRPNHHSLISILTAEELSPRFVSQSATLVYAVECFYSDPDLRILPVVDDQGRPIGAVFEKDVRRLLLNPYGHALLRNPSIGGNLSDSLRDCPTIDVTDDIGALVDHYRRCDGREGMILTSGGTLFATLTNRRLLMLAAEREHRASSARLERAQRIERAAMEFETRTGALATQMVQLANGVQRLAEATVDRSTIAGRRAADMGTAAAQTRDSLTYMAERGRGLSSAFERIEQSLASNRSVAARTVSRVTEGGSRARELQAAAQSIDSVMSLISNIAGTVNLLSLNAAIEAARAGDAGRGFAVVASEIRSLSDQTQEATEVIASQVQLLKDGVDRIASDYGEVEASIVAMADGAAAIDEAITAEADTTRLIAHSVSEAGDASVAIHEAIHAIVHSVRSASSSASELDRMANDLRSGASELGSSVAGFLQEVCAA